MKMSCEVKPSFFKPHLPKQSPNIASLVSKKGFFGKFLICFTEKNPQFGNISLERVFLRGQTEMSSANAYACTSHKPLQLDLLISFPYKKLYATQPIQKKLFLQEQVKKKVSTGATNFFVLSIYISKTLIWSYSTSSIFFDDQSAIIN